MMPRYVSHVKMRAACTEFYKYKAMNNHDERGLCSKSHEHGRISSTYKMGSSATPATIALTPEFLEKSLGSKILSYTVNPGSSAGDNFTSIVHAIHVKYQKQHDGNKSQELRLMLKSYPSHPARRSFLDDTHMFKKELMVYKYLIPELKQFGRANVRNFDTDYKLALAPFIDGNSTEPDADAKSGENSDKGFDSTKNFILMVDVRSWGFKMADKAPGLDYNHSKLVITELAKLHALNWAYSTKNRIESLEGKFPFLKDEVMCTKQAPMLNGLFGQNYQLIKDLLEAELGSTSDMFKGFQRFETSGIETMLLFTDGECDEDKISNLFRIKPKTVTVTGSGCKTWKCGSHGDMWVNNFLFRYAEDGTPVETIFVDLQLYREASPTVDLAYFIYSSTNSALRKKHLDDLLRLYLEVFLAKCKVLNVDPFPGFSLPELKRRFHLAKLYGLIIAILILPIILVKPEEANDLDTVCAETTKFDDMLKGVGKASSAGNDLKKRVSELVRELYEEGLV